MMSYDPSEAELDGTTRPISRLIFMGMSGPPGTGLLAMRAVIDVVSAKRLDFSINLSPFPVRMITGTVIRPGIMVDIEDVALFGFVIIKKAFFHFSPRPFALEVGRFQPLAGFTTQTKLWVPMSRHIQPQWGYDNSSNSSQLHVDMSTSAVLLSY